MTPDELDLWRNMLIARLEDIRSMARQYRQLMEIHGLDELEDKTDIAQAWRKVTEMFPDDFQPHGASGLGRHIRFAMQGDFADIERWDVPGIIHEVERYGRRGNDFIRSELDRLAFGSDVGTVIHPRIQDACADLMRQRKYKEVVRAAVDLVMDDLRRLSGESGDGDALIRGAVKTTEGHLAFSACDDPNAKNVTEGLKQVLQGIYKGVRNPVSHGWSGFNRSESLQILATCSLLLSRLQRIAPTVED